MEWNMMEPGGSGASAIGSLIEDVYIPSDECEDVLDEIIETLLKEDQKLRNGRRKLFFDKVIEKDLVPLVKCCADEDIVALAVRLLANLSQPLEVFLQLGYPLGAQCQREIIALVNSAKACCVDIDFFKSLHSRIFDVLGRGGKVEPSGSEMINHCLLLMRNLLHVGMPAASIDSPPAHSSITLQSMLSSFFLSEMDKLVLRLLNHPQKADWVVSVVQLLSLVFKDYAGVLLDGDGEEEDKEDTDSRSDEDAGSDMLEFIPSQTSKFLSKDFDKQLQLGTGAVPERGAGSGGASEEKVSCASDQVENSSISSSQEGHKENMMQTDNEDGEGKCDSNMHKTLTKTSSDEGLGESVSMSGSSDRKDKSDFKSSPPDSLEQEEFMSMSEDSEGKVKAFFMAPEAQQSTESGQRDNEEMMVVGDDGKGRRNSDRSSKDGEVWHIASMVWDNIQQTVAVEKEIMSELSGSCLMDVDIIVSYLKQFASEIVCSGLSNLVRCLMKALMSTYEGVLDDSFFMWTVGFFLSYARHSHIQFEKYKEIVNLDVFGFLVYQGFRNCETLVIQHHKGENCSLTKYRLHLVVCTLNQMFQVILTRCKDDLADSSYLCTLQRCLAQMGDLQRLFFLLIRAYQSPPQDFVYLRDLVHTNHIYLLLLEDWVSQGYIPPHFSMLSHIQQFATVEVMGKYGSLLEEYTNNKETLNVAVMTMMYHVAGDCNRGDVLFQLPILKKFSEIWGDIICTKYVEFNDLIEFVLENFMTLAFQDPVKCAQKLFDLATVEAQAREPDSVEKAEKLTTTEMRGLSAEEQDLLLTWTSDLQGSISMVDDLVQRLHNRGFTTSRQQVMLHLLRNGWLEEKQMEALSEEIKELQDVTGEGKESNIFAELSSLEQEQLLPFLLEKVKAAGFGDQLVWLQEQLLEAAYVRLGVRNPKYRVHVEEPLARFYALQDKSIPLVTVNEVQERVVKDPYFTVLLQSLGLFLADTDNFFFCRIPHFLTPAELVRKAQQLGDLDVGILKFDLAEVDDDLTFTEITPLFRDHNDLAVSKLQSQGHSSSYKKPARDHQSHQWLNFVCRLNKSKQVDD